MMPTRIDSIETATVLRGALVRLWREFRPWVTDEPESALARGMCITTSQMLRLIDPSWSLVYGYVGSPGLPVTNGGPHTWCQRGGIVLDLTADQFPGYPPVVFGPRPDGYSGSYPDGGIDVYDQVGQIVLDQEYREAQDWCARIERELNRGADPSPVDAFAGTRVIGTTR